MALWGIKSMIYCLAMGNILDKDEGGVKLFKKILSLSDRYLVLYVGVNLVKCLNLCIIDTLL